MLRLSRRTAYRYFPSQRKLLSDAALDGLRPIMERAIEVAAPGTGTDDAETRIDSMVKSMQQLAIENELLLRTMIHETVLQKSGAEPRRGRRRLDWIEQATRSMRARLGGALYSRLVSGLALCAGIEALLVLRDICGLSPAETTEVSQWMARSLLRESLAESAKVKARQRGT